MITSIYIHIPFCRNICNYCDFTKMYYDEKIVNNYLDELKKEVLEKYKNETIKTIYVGGGTPSLLNDNELDKLFEIIDLINLADNYECSFECNIENINKNLLNKLKENKVNRISIGVQSFNKDILQFLGRNYEIDYLSKIKEAQDIFENISIDLMYGMKNQSIDQLQEDLKKIIEINPKHISIYALILENNTVLKIKGYVELEDDVQRDMYDLICKMLKENGYNHYEISNFAKEGNESKHNLVYWNNERYYGFGLGASGYINNVRYTNTKSINNYLKGNYVYVDEIVSKKIDMENEMIFGLRKIKGVSKIEFENKYNEKIEKVFNVERLSFQNGYYFIKEDDLYISNSILCDFINI